jgi:two-component system chemotaxis response regulator CheB
MPKTRVLVVDDAVVIRKLITETLNRDPQLEVVGTAPNGRIALQKITQINPDIIILDVEMPEMDGLQTIKEIRKLYPKLPVIMFSTLTGRGTVTTIEALTAGASDYVCKPGNLGCITEAIDKLESDLIPKIRNLCPGTLPPRAAVAANAPPIFPSRFLKPTRVDILAVGTSTGGPNALAEVFKSFPREFPVPIVVVQHMPPTFTALLAERLTANSPVKFQEGAEGMELLPGHGYIAPGGKHMILCREQTRVVSRLNEAPPENSCRPAVDVLFRSVVKAYGAATLGVILTGMGYDGLRGCQLIREQNGQIIAQDEASSVVWGMPGAVAQAGLADRVVPLAQVCTEIVRRVRSGRLPVRLDEHAQLCH